MKTAILVFSVSMLLTSSSYAANCKVFNHTDIPDFTPRLTEILTEHGYMVTDDEDAQYSVTSATDFDDARSRIETDIQLMSNNAEITNGTGDCPYPFFSLKLLMCSDKKLCIPERYQKSLNRALENFKENLEVCHTQ